MICFFEQEPHGIHRFGTGNTLSRIEGEVIAMLRGNQFYNFQEWLWLPLVES